MHPERLMVLAAIAEPAQARITLLAIDVWLHATAITDLHVAGAGAHSHHLDAQFVAGNARVTKKWHRAKVAPIIGAADADAVHTHHRFPRSWCVRFRPVDPAEVLRFFQQQTTHQRARFFSGAVGRL